MNDLEVELGPQELSEDDSDSLNYSKTGRGQKIPVVSPVCEATPNESGFHQSTRMCLKQIREALLHHRWQEAAEYIACYPQKLEDTLCGTARLDKEIMWRIGTELLHHHSKSTMDDYNNIYEQIKHTSVRHFLMISLEHSFHLLLNGHFEDAKRQLSVAESWRHGKESTTQIDRTKFIQAYKSFMDYMIWCDKRHTQSNSGYINSGDNKEMHNYFRQASVILREILRHPGVWDPFILSYVEMLEFYEDYEEALQVLTTYANDSKFPPNPNAHVYLYQYLKRHEFSNKEQQKVLKGLHVLVPSHELMLEYSFLLLHSEKTDNIQKALGVVLEMLDFACWRSSLDVWKRLKEIIQKLQLQKNWKEIVSKNMAARKDWWPALHFTSFHAGKDSEENPELMEVKASLTEILCPYMNLKYRVQTRGEQTEERNQV
ncbi:TATA box-binding protein-associated factor RNA polymerase I subunit A isoform X2 [Halichoeres trimaculatus]|uniref:TATA box-binding protein-associated factor RNA polymerase I subunit A isoform X2 n=1 Tax=Halichoeres trimaculatus TaxID=147232 RepID=UPI003D9E187E